MATGRSDLKRLVSWAPQLTLAPWHARTSNAFVSTCSMRRQVLDNGSVGSFDKGQGRLQVQGPQPAWSGHAANAQQRDDLPQHSLVEAGCEPKMCQSRVVLDCSQTVFESHQAHTDQVARSARSLHTQLNPTAAWRSVI